MVSLVQSFAMVWLAVFRYAKSTVFNHGDPFLESSPVCRSYLFGSTCDAKPRNSSDNNSVNVFIFLVALDWFNIIDE